MSRHARIEEISDSDSDPDIMDPSEFNNSGALMEPSQIPSIARPQQERAPARQQYDPSKTKRWICLYPIYFDAAKTRAQGRRVGKTQAVSNPLARTIAGAAASQGLNVVFEPGKTHPKDWANPGRVRIELKGLDGKLKMARVKNKHHLYILVAKYLADNQTTPSTPMELPIRGIPVPEEPPGPPAVPRGWKINDILPLHSPALSGGGVSEDFMKDMMAQMGGGALGGAPGGPGSSGKKLKKVIRV